MFTIETSGTDNSRQRVVSTEPLTSADFEAVARELGTAAFRARKTGLVAARKSERGEAVETNWNGRETTNTAAPGDWVVTNMTGDGRVLRDAAGHPNVYVIRAQTFPTLYESTGATNEFGSLHKAKGTVEALHIPGGFEIAAPWGERQVAHSGYLIRTAHEVYGNNAETFEATYERVR